MSRLSVLNKATLSLAMFALVVFGSATLANADTVTFDINRGSTLPNQQYGQITLTLQADGSILVNVNLINGNRLIETGQGISIGFNSSISPNPGVTITGLPAGYTPDATLPGSFGADGFGTFEYAIHSSFGANDAGALSALSFTVTRTSGTFSTVNQLVELSTNPPGDILSPFAFDIFCPTCNNGNGATGFVGTGVSPVPEPATMFLLGSALVGLGAKLRRRRKK